MTLAYVTTYDASDVHAWSGSGNFILRALQDGGFQTKSIGNLKDKQSLLLKVKNAYYHKLLSKTHLRDREPIILRDYARQVEKDPEFMSCDIVFSPGTIPIAYLQTEKPIAFWTDATFAGLLDFYVRSTDLSAESIKNGHKMEQLALSKCRVAIYSSEWAAKTAIQNYDVNPEKVKVVPFGANLICNRTLVDINRSIENKSSDICKLLFLGVDWYGKDGDMALTVAELLTKRGIRTELHIVGCNPPVRLPNFVKLHGFISKKSKEGRQVLDKLLSESHFLILPSRAECAAVVFAEASSFGLPSLATKVGGVPTVIRDGKNGQTFPLDENPEKYCDYIERLMSSKEEYRKLAVSSFREYSERLNWLSAGGKVHDLLLEFCG